MPFLNFTMAVGRAMLTPSQFEVDKYDIFGALKNTSYSDIVQLGQKTQDDDLLATYILYTLDDAYFVIDQIDSCVVAAFIKSDKHGFFCFHFLSGSIEHVLDVSAFLAFMSENDSMPQYLATCEAEGDVGMETTVLKLLPSSAFSVTEAVRGHRPSYHRGICGPRDDGPITVTVLKVIAAWKQQTRRMVLKVLFHGKTYALKIFVLRGNADQLNDSPLLHEAKIYEQVQHDPDLANHTVKFHAFGYVFSNDGLSTGPFCFSKPRTDKTCTWVFTCFTMTEFMTDTLADLLVASSYRLKPTPAQVQDLVRQTLVTIHACNQKKLQHNDVKLDNVFVCGSDGRRLREMDKAEFEKAVFIVKLYDFDLSSFDHPQVGQNPFFRYGSCSSTGLGASFNPWSDLFKFLYYLSVYCPHLLPAHLWDQIIFVQPVTESPSYDDLNQLQTKHGEHTDLYVRYCNIIARRGAVSFTPLKDCSEHYALIQKAMPPFQTLLSLLT